MATHFATWGLTEEQAATQHELRQAVDRGAKTPCRGSDQWDDKLEYEHHASLRRMARLQWAQEQCLSCPLMSNVCKAVKDQDKDLRGVVAGEIISDHKMEEVAA